MRTKIIIAGVVVVVILGGLAVYADSASLKKMGQAAEATWPGQSAYQPRLAKIDKLKNDLVKAPALASDPTVGGLVNKLAQAETALQAATDQTQEIKAINKIEKDTADVIEALPGDSALENAPNVSTDVAAVSTQESAAWVQPYDDAAAFYNIAIHRIRHRITAAVFSLKPIAPVASVWQYLMAKKAGK